MVRSSKYPWGDWLDGRVWLLRAHHDFMCLLSSLQSQAHTAAKDAGVAVATRDVGLGLLVQAYPNRSTWKPNLSAIPAGNIDRAANRSIQNRR
jgi:hypothetical protein